MYDLGNRLTLENNFVSIQNEHTLKETKVLQGNQRPYFNRDLCKQIVIKPRLKNKTNKSKYPINNSKCKLKI